MHTLSLGLCLSSTNSNNPETVIRWSGQSGEILRQLGDDTSTTTTAATPGWPRTLAMPLARFHSFRSWPGLLQVISTCPAWPAGVSFLLLTKNTLVKKKKELSGFIWLTVPSYSPPFWAGVKQLVTAYGQSKAERNEAPCLQPLPSFLPSHAAQSPTLRGCCTYLP